MENKKSFSISEAIHTGWEIAKQKWGYFFKVGLVLLLLQALVTIPGSLVGQLADELEKSGSGDESLSFLIMVLSVVLSVAAQVLITIFSLGFVKITLDVLDNKPSAVKDLFSQKDKLIQYILASVYYTLIVLGGFLLLIIPGIIWSIKYGYYAYFIIDKGYSAKEAIKASAEMTEGNKWNLFGLGFVLGLVNILGMLALFIGLILTIPTTILARAFVYRKLTNQMSGEEPVVVSTQPVTPAIAPAV